MSFSSSNLHYLFHREYFEGLDLLDTAQAEKTEKLLQKRTEELLSVPLSLSLPFPELHGLMRHFSLYSAYPGLTMGLGYPHDAKLAGAVKLGFSFDYVSGVPYLPGSSLKGILRSCFRQPELISRFLPAGEFSLPELETDLFCGEDVFLGAYPVAAEGPLLGLDFITPHPSRFAEPRPLPLFVIRPNTELAFCFILHDSLLSAAEKETLYRALLLETGVGAKTNVGYGRLTKEKTAVNTPGFDNKELEHELGLIPEPKTVRVDAAFEDGAVLGPCPKCGAEVVRCGEQVVCKNNCGIRFRKVLGAEVSDRELSLLLHGERIVIRNIKDLKKDTERPASVFLDLNGQRYCPDGKNGEKKGLYRPKYNREWLE